MFSIGRQAIHFLPFILLFVIEGQGQSNSRLENEFKLSVPISLEDSVWQFLQDDFIKENGIKNFSLSEEKFIDRYFDSKNEDLKNDEAGLRFRQRYIDEILEKELIQLKLPIDENGIVREEIKYEKSDKLSFDDPFSRHELLKYLNQNDRDDLEFHLTPYKIRLGQIKKIESLVQKRKRIYLFDEEDIALATVTLDKVSNLKFPFHHFTELEIELNEIRYTQADSLEKANLEHLSHNIKSSITNRFTQLVVDQTPKYNKMRTLTSNSLLYNLGRYIVWFVFGMIVLAALFLLR